MAQFLPPPSSGGSPGTAPTATILGSTALDATLTAQDTVAAISGGVASASESVTVQWAVISPRGTDETASILSSSTAAAPTWSDFDAGSLHESECGGYWQLRVTITSVATSLATTYTRRVRVGNASGLVKSDLSDTGVWTQDEGSVTGLVDSVSSTEVVIADSVADAVGEFTLFVGPTLTAMQRVAWKIIRTDSNANACALMVGITDTSDRDHGFMAGIRHTTGALAQVVVANTAGIGTAVGSTSVLLNNEFITSMDVSGDLKRLPSGYALLETSGDLVVQGQDSVAGTAASAFKLIVAVHRNATSGSTSAVGYQLWYRVWDL